MTIVEREAIHKAIFAIVGDTRDSTVLPGGDLSVAPINNAQQKVLLGIQTLAGRPAAVSLPDHSFHTKVGVIFGIPISDSEDDILKALSDQNVTQVKRLPIRNLPGSLSTTVLLTFSTAVPDRIKIASISHQVQVSVPNPYRCRTCWRLGHTSKRCNAKEPNCKRCEKITVHEARVRHGKLYSTVTNRSTTPPSRSPMAQHQRTEMAALQEQMAALQEEIQGLTANTIPLIHGELKTLAAHLDNTKIKVNSFNVKFNEFEAQQKANVEIQQSRFDRLEEILLGKAFQPINYPPGRSLSPTGASRLPSSMNQSTLNLSPMFNDHGQCQDAMDTEHGLSKAKLEEFRQFLSLVTPSIVLLSETHWKKPLNIKFKSYHILQKNRPDKSGTVEAIGVSIPSRNNSATDFISAYVPKGDCEIEDIEYLINRPNPSVICGDFNGHHGMWENNSQPNKAGKSIYEAIVNSHNTCLLTPQDLAWSSFISNLGTQEQPRLWSFTKSMIGKGSNLSPDGTPILSNNTQVNCPAKKVELFLDHFMSVFPANIPINSHFESTINSSKAHTIHNLLNDAITPEEHEISIPKFKSRAVGPDLVKNSMLRRLSPENKGHLLHLFNVLLSTSTLPPQWKESTVIPLLKPGKAAKDPTSYRPIALTSCLCKRWIDWSPIAFTGSLKRNRNSIKNKPGSGEAVAPQTISCN
uniref:Endonuclease/exonuclease/phosphatase domain-containing protein n=1 Tax=Daphnia galeata TaxID=27404 RepID=A0A8J2WCD0_9CRUS|nr:unnamed protein product [Daphnia galeata]